MKKSIVALCALLFSLSVSAAEFVDPRTFDGSEQARKDVVSFIEQNVKETYGKIGMDDAVTLRAMEKEQLKAFKELTKAKNTELLEGVIKQYCAIGMCDYVTILAMYNEQSKASKEKLSW